MCSDFPSQDHSPVSEVSVNPGTGQTQHGPFRARPPGTSTAPATSRIASRDRTSTPATMIAGTRGAPNQGGARGHHMTSGTHPPVGATRPPVDSLSARDIDLLLRTVRAHQSHLDGAHHDARHILMDDRRPAYVIDFDLLYRFIFDTSPDWTRALEYLFLSVETTYLIGPGTSIEIDRLLRRAPTAKEETSWRRNESALRRLDELLRRPNVVMGVDVASGVDETAYQLVKESLDISRRRTTEVPNQADALNWAYVVHLRRHLGNAGIDFFPYLMTGTRLLLDEQALDPNHSVPISRSVQSAIYSNVLLRIYSEPRPALRHTVEMAFHAAQIERDLRLSDAYVHPDRFQDDPDWELVVSEGRMGAPLKTQILGLAKYVIDPVLYEAQRIYDNVYVAATNQAQLGGAYPFVGETPRRLFDLIGAISATLSASIADEHGGLQALWGIVLALKFTRQPECTTVELLDRAGSVGPAYLAVEVHPPAPGRERPLFILRWPSCRDAASLIGAFMALVDQQALVRSR